MDDRFYGGRQHLMYALEMLGTLGVPHHLIDEVRSMLSSNATALEESKPSPIGAVFGGSEQGARLTHQADAARQHVAEAVLQMAAGLRGFRADLAAHETRMHDTDTQNAQSLQRIQAATACVAPTTFATNPSCPLPTTPEGGA